MQRGRDIFGSKKPRFSGHETFPLRYGWLQKAYDAVVGSTDGPTVNGIFKSDEAIANLGVGKNMVSSIRHWAMACNVITNGNEPNTIEITEFGRKIFGSNGLDPYMEHPASLWLIHWHLASKLELTTWYWAFNVFPEPTFGRESLTQSLMLDFNGRGRQAVSATTIRRDIECFLRTYVARRPSGNDSLEQTLESPLVELGLIKAIGKHDGFHFVRGSKSTLGSSVFLYALIEFWKGYSARTKTLSFEAITYEPGSPGRIFLLDENEVVNQLHNLERLTKGDFQWSETAGLKRIQRKKSLEMEYALKFLDQDFFPESRIKRK